MACGLSTCFKDRSLVRLLIISNMPHYRKDGQVLGWGPTVQEIDHLAGLFNRIDHIACLHPEPAPASSLPYVSGKVRLIPVQPTGGTSLRDKFEILCRFPNYARTILRELPGADVVHIRCPASICLLAILMLSLRRQPELRWVKYAGEWQRDGREPASYAFQRWWLKKSWSRSWVTVNGEFRGQPSHVRPFFNPCLDDTELAQAGRLAVQKPPVKPLGIVFVGNLNPNKGVLRALEIVRLIRSSGVDAKLEVVGDGAERPLLEQKIAESGMTDAVTLHGWLPRTALGEIYARNHLFLMTSRTEGWPKVLSEAMAYGVVPIASAISCIPDYLGKFRTGQTMAWDDLPAFAEAAMSYYRTPSRWRQESARAVAVAKQFSYSNYLKQVRALLGLQ